MSITQAVERAAAALHRAEALVVLAGAGMGVDSGLPSFRDAEGLWRAYPPLRQLGLNFAELAAPRWFVEDPTLAWGFYGHRLQMYQQAEPHLGFQILRDWSHRQTTQIITSNVDGHFQRAGFQRVWEIHGAIGTWQCSVPCHTALWPATSPPAVDDETVRANEPLPRCPRCGSVARPNILMFHDGNWLPQRSDEQHQQVDVWLQRVQDKSVVCLEIGAGTAVPTIRNIGSDLRRRLDVTYVRINPDVMNEADDPEIIGLPLPAAAALQQLDEALLFWQ